MALEDPGETKPSDVDATHRDPPFTQPIRQRCRANFITEARGDWRLNLEDWSKEHPP